MFESIAMKARCLGSAILLVFGTGAAATTNQVVVDDTTIGATTTYTVTFKAAQGIGSGADSINFNSNGGADLSAATFLGVTGGNGLVINQSSASASVVLLNVSGGSANTGDVLSLQFANVVNPSTEGLGPNYTVGQIDALAQPPIPVFISLPGTVYTGTSQPVVVDPIADRTGPAALEEGQPPFTASNDLNTVFQDADGDPMTFSLDPGTDTSIATAQITPDDRLLVTPVASGTTTVSVRATAVDGFAVDSFEVQVIGLIDDAVMTLDNLRVGETASYVLTFSAAGALGAGQGILVITEAGGPNYTGSALTFSGGSLSASLGLASAEAFLIDLNSGSAPPGTPISITLDGVTNPGNPGPGPDYPIRIVDSITLGDFDRGSALGNVFEAGGAPFVIDPIDDRSLFEVDGPDTVVADISTVFDEDDGDPVSYSVLAGNDPAIATAALNEGALVVTPTGPGQTTITVEASDVDGAITDSFEVAVVGIMDDATFGPDSNATGILSSYTFSFTISTEMEADLFAIFLNNRGPGGPDYSQAQLLEFSGGDLDMSLEIAGLFSTGIFLTGSVSVGETVSFTLGNVLNPDSGGLGPDYEATLINRVGPTTLESTEIAGSEFQAPADPVFEDRFEASPP